MKNQPSVSLEDKFVLDYLLIKHFQIWQDINRNRKIYVGTLTDDTWLFEIGFNEEEYTKRRRSHVERQLDNLKSDEKKQIVKEVLEKLFPDVGSFMKGNGKSNVAMQDLLHDRKVGHPDILDAYFGSSDRYELFLSNKKFIEGKLEGAAGAKEETVFSGLKDILDKARSETVNESSLITLTQEHILRTYSGSDLIFTLRAWLRSYMETTGYLVREENGALIKIISTIDRGIGRMPNQADRQSALNTIFKDIHDFIRHPSSGLRLLLYMHPTRNNHFSTLREYKDMGILYENVLRFTDRFYMEQGVNIYLEGPGVESGDWRFILYQWALSISNSNGAGDGTIEVPFPQLRYEAVNKYVFNLLFDDSRLAYQVVLKQFWQSDFLEEGDVRKWILKGNIDPYDQKQLKELASRLASDNKLTRAERKKMQDFLDHLEQHLE